MTSGQHAKTKSAGSQGTYKLGHKAGAETSGNAKGLRNYFGNPKPIEGGNTSSRGSKGC